MKTIRASDLEKNISKEIETVVESGKAISVISKIGNAVILSERFYNSLLETIYILSQPKLLEKIKNGEKEDIDSLNIYYPKEDWPSA